MPSLTLLLFWVAAAICVIAQLAVLRSGLRARTDSGAGRSARFKEIAWAVLPAIVLGLVLVATWRTVTVRHSVTTHSMSAAP